MLTSYNGKSFSYDTIGNLLSDGTWNYTWSQGRQLATMSKSGASWLFTYDAGGMRTKRTSGSTSTTYNYTYNGSLLTHMTYGSNSLHFYYDASGKPLSVVYNGSTYYYILSLQGNVVAILDSSGVSVVEYTYDAWGRPLTTTGSMAASLGLHNPLRYRGYVYDQETGLYYLQSRYYNPAICRFISADVFVSTGQGILGYNMFAYCGNNPVNRIDPDGYFWQDVWSAIGDAAYWLYYNATKWHFEDREQRNGDHPSYTEVTSDGSWRLLPSGESIYHDNGIGNPELKYVTDDGREAVFNGDTYEIMTDPRYVATYNYCSISTLPENSVFSDYVLWVGTRIGHFVTDVLPYYLTGCSNTREQFETKIVRLFS